MYTLLIPDSVGSFVNSMMQAYMHKPLNSADEANMSKYLPRWPLWGRETNTMVANHAVPVIVEAYLKGLLSDVYTTDDYFQAILTSLNMPHYRNHVELIDKYGYIPYDAKIRLMMTVEKRFPDCLKVVMMIILQGCLQVS